MGGLGQGYGGQGATTIGTRANIDASESVEKLAPVERCQVGRLHWRCLRVFLFTLPFESGACDRKLGVDVAGGIETEVSGLDEAGWQDVQEKSAHEFQRGKLADLLVAGSEDDTVVVDVEDTMVGDGDPVGIQAEVTKERVGLLEGGLGEDNPRLAVQRVFQLGEGRGLEQTGHALGNAGRDGELAFVEESRKTVEKFATKERAQDVDREQVFFVRIDPPALGIEATAGHDAMQVRMKNEISAPGMDDGSNPEQAAQAPRIAGELQEGCSGGGEQEVEEKSLVGAHELA